MGELAAWASGVTGMAVVLPQMVRMLCIRDASGVYAAGLAGSCVGYLGWFVYALARGDAAAAFAASLPGLVQVVSLGMSLRWGGDRSAFGPPVVAFAVAALAYASGGPATLAVSLLLVGAAAYFSTILAAYRGPSVRGLSPLSWLLSALTGGLYGTYGVLISDGWMAASGVMNGVCSAVMVALTRRPRRRDAAPGLTGGPHE